MQWLISTATHIRSFPAIRGDSASPISAITGHCGAARANIGSRVLIILGVGITDHSHVTVTGTVTGTTIPPYLRPSVHTLTVCYCTFPPSLLANSGVARTGVLRRSTFGTRLLVGRNSWPMAHGPWREQHPRTQTRPGQARGRQNREGELPKEAERAPLRVRQRPCP